MSGAPVLLPRPSRALVWAGLLVLSLTVALDSLRHGGAVRANGILDERFFPGFSDFDPAAGGRLGHTASRIEVPGFGPSEEVRVLLLFARAEGPLLLEGATLVAGETARATVRSDAAGWVSLRLLDPGGKKRGIFQLRGVETEASPALGPPSRLFLELLALALLFLLVASACEGAWAQGVGFALPGALFLLALALFRPYLLAYLPLLVGLGAGGIVFLGVCRTLGVPARAGGLLASVFLLRVGLVLLPSFPSIDAEFHAHNVERFDRGEVLKSRAPGAERGESLSVPYPPALYAFLAYQPGGSGTRAVRLVTGLLEGTTPLLVFLVLRAAGASPEVAAGAGCVSASLPEGVLVLGKGIAANILGSWATLWFAWAWLRKSPVLVLGALLALTFLSHWGVSLCLGVLLVLLLCQKETGDRGTLLLAALFGALVAWAVYYREVLGLAGDVLGSLGGHLQGAPAHFVRVRWIRVGKTLQDLLLKFGGGSLVLLALARHESVPPRLRLLLRAWFGAGLLAGLLALFTPVPLRFEYFLTAPVAMGAGFGAERLRREGRKGTLALLLVAGLVLELLIAVFLIFQRFDLLSVIQESETWTFPFYFWGRTSG